MAQKEFSLAQFNKLGDNERHGLYQVATKATEEEFISYCNLIGLQICPKNVKGAMAYLKYKSTPSGRDGTQINDDCKVNVRRDSIHSDSSDTNM